MKSKGKVLVGILGGAAAGAIVSLLFAPNKGSETRKKIAKKSTDTVNDVKNKISHLIDDVTGKIEDGKEELAGVYGKMKDKVEGFSKDGKVL
ncbi:MAG TPA: YtxH domain-containing protein [Edaphocola sp.]|nr:YtxH domain-containing protein [Edaphocola sp.]